MPGRKRGENIIKWLEMDCGHLTRMSGRKFFPLNFAQNSAKKYDPALLTGGMS
jgi:hypothetical protein